MSIQVITDIKKRKEWNNAVKHPLQTWEWGEVKTKTGNTVLRVAVVDEKGAIQQGFLITIHPLFGDKTIAHSARGEWPNAEVVSAVRQMLTKYNCIFWKIEPFVFRTEAGVYRIPLAEKIWRFNGTRYALSSSPIFAQHTFLVDLRLSAAELLVRMKSKTRYNIRLAQKRGVVVKDISNDKNGFNIFFNLYEQTLRRQHYLGHNKEYHQTVWRLMHEVGYAQNFAAYYKGKPLAVYQVFFFGERAYYLYGGTSSEYREVMASNLLMWEVFLAAKKRGCTEFDMWGALPEAYNPRHPWAGFHRFKEGYGGIHRSYIGSIDIIVQPIYYRLFSLLWPIRNALLSAKQRLGSWLKLGI